MPINVYSSFIELLRNDADISPLLADYKGFKAVFAGVQPEDSIDMPSITVNAETDEILPSKTTDQFFIVNVYASNIIQANYISRVICGTLDDRTRTYDGVTMRFVCNKLTSFGTPVDREFNSPISVRVTYYGD